MAAAEPLGEPSAGLQQTEARGTKAHAARLRTTCRSGRLRVAGVATVSRRASSWALIGALVGTMAGCSRTQAAAGPIVLIVVDTLRAIT